jgi:hypothetical protein
VDESLLQGVPRLGIRLSVEEIVQREMSGSRPSDLVRLQGG